MENIQALAALPGICLRLAKCKKKKKGKKCRGLTRNANNASNYLRHPKLRFVDWLTFL